MVRGGLSMVDLRLKSSCQTRTLGDLGEMHPTEMFLLPRDTFWSVEKCPRLVHPAQDSSPTGGGTESPKVQRPLAGDPPGPKGNTGPRPQPPACRAAGPRGAAAGSETRSRVRHQPQVPREQAHEVEDDGGFVAPRRVLEPGKETSGAEAGISSRETPLGPSPPERPSNPHGPSLDSRPAPPHTVPAGVYSLSGPAPLTALRVLGRLLGDRTDFLQEPGRTSWSWRGDRR